MAKSCHSSKTKTPCPPCLSLGAPFSSLPLIQEDARRCRAGLEEMSHIWAGWWAHQWCFFQEQTNLCSAPHISASCLFAAASTDQTQSRGVPNRKSSVRPLRVSALVIRCSFPCALHTNTVVYD